MICCLHAATCVKSEVSYGVRVKLRYPQGANLTVLGTHHFQGIKQGPSTPSLPSSFKGVPHPDLLLGTLMLGWAPDGL